MGKISSNNKSCHSANNSSEPIISIKCNQKHEPGNDINIVQSVKNGEIPQIGKCVSEYKDWSFHMDNKSKQVDCKEVHDEYSDSAVTLYQCFHCDYKINKRYLLSRHLKSHSEDRPHKCSFCERGFKTNASLINHVNSHLGKKPHLCNFCEKSFTTSGELVRHVRYRHTGDKPHKCSECNYSSVELSKLRRHIRCHTGERPYQCPHCAYASPDTFKLKRHLRTHTGEKPYECEICNAKFTQSNSLKAHRLIHTVGDKPIFQCSLCPTTCGRKTDLRLHIQKLHESDKPIECKRCGKNLPDRYSYKLHIKTHEGEKCFQCKICPYASISQRHLDSHMLLHTDEKPYVCEHCKMAFRQRQLLKRHINLHHNKNYVPPMPREKIHFCPHCDRNFTHKGNLMRHMDIHDPISNTLQEKFKLKVGRCTRIQPNNTVFETSNIKKNKSIEFEDNSKFEVVETIENLINGIESKYDSDSNSLKKINISKKNITNNKKSQIGKELMAVEMADGQQYTVEVYQSDEEDDYNHIIIETVDENELDEEDDYNHIIIDTVDENELVPKQQQF